MDWNLAIERNREVLIGILSALFALVTASRISGACGLMVPRRVWLAVLLVLRPMESAVRRLVLLASRDLTPFSFKPRAASFIAIMPAVTTREPMFGLIDPLRDVFSPLCSETENSWADLSQEYTKALPEQTDGHMELPQDATHIHTRLRALRHALADLQRQARRLARWKARRDSMLRGDLPAKGLRITPIRPGLPPGWRVRRTHEIDDVLRECHRLARDWLNAPNTS